MILRIFRPSGPQPFLMLACPNRVLELVDWNVHVRPLDKLNADAPHTSEVTEKGVSLFGEYDPGERP